MAILTPKNPILCAIDTTDLAHARQLAQTIAPHIGGIKLGLEFFVSHGIEGIKRVAGDNIPLFLDLKFHDIPNTVAGAIRATAGIPCFMMTIHASGGASMMAAAKQAASALPHSPNIIGVSVLTSMDQADLAQVGVATTIENQVVTLAKLAQANGVDGLVCSPQEIKLIREKISSRFELTTPGIRPEGCAKGDQKRTLTPKEAIDAGANYLVIGRPITQSENPAETAAKIAQSCGF